jgi:hypothetical protein
MYDPFGAAVYNRFWMTPIVKKSVLQLARIKRLGVAAISDERAEVVRLEWAEVGASHLPDLNFDLVKRGIAWLLGIDLPPTNPSDLEGAVATRVQLRARMRLNDQTICKLHAIAAPGKEPHRYDTKDEQTAYVDVTSGVKVSRTGRLREPNTEWSGRPLARLEPSPRVLYVCPLRREVPALMRQMFDVVTPLPIPIGNAVLHLNITAIHPFYDGNSHVRAALTLARLLSVTHPDVGPHVLPTLQRYWDGFFNGYEQVWLGAAGNTLEPQRDVTSWVDWYIAAEARLIEVAAVAAKTAASGARRPKSAPRLVLG